MALAKIFSASSQFERVSVKTAWALVRVAVVDFWESRLRPRSSVASSMLSFVP